MLNLETKPLPERSKKVFLVLEKDEKVFDGIVVYIIKHIRLGNLLERVDTAVVSCDYPHIAAFAADREVLEQCRFNW